MSDEEAKKLSDTPAVQIESAKSPFHVDEDDRTAGSAIEKIRAELVKVKQEMVVKKAEYVEKYPFSTPSARAKAYDVVVAIMTAEQRVADLLLEIVRFETVVATETEYFEEDFLDIIGVLGWGDNILKLHHQHDEHLFQLAASFLEHGSDPREGGKPSARMEAATALLRAKLRCSRHKDEPAIGKGFDGTFICALCSGSGSGSAKA